MSLCVTACRVQEYVVKYVERKRPPPVFLFGLVEGDDPAARPAHPGTTNQDSSPSRSRRRTARGRHPHPHRPNVASCPVRPWVRRGRRVRPAAAPRPPQARSAPPEAGQRPSPRRPRAPAAARFQVREKKRNRIPIECFIKFIRTHNTRNHGAGAAPAAATSMDK